MHRLFAILVAISLMFSGSVLAAVPLNGTMDCCESVCCGSEQGVFPATERCPALGECCPVGATVVLLALPVRNLVMVFKPGGTPGYDDPAMEPGRLKAGPSSPPPRA